MNVSLPQDLSVYQLAAGLQTSHQPLFFSPVVLLSLVRSQIDILIEGKIKATLWVKFPPSKIWQFEIQRYYQESGVSGNVINCYTPNKEEEKNSSPLPSDLQTQNALANKLQREYFLIILSPQFCSLIVACKPSKRRKNYKPTKEKTTKISSLLTFSTFEDRTVQHVLNGIQKAIATEISSLKPTDFVCSATFDPILINRLLVRQLQRQDEINRQITTKRLTQRQQQNQKLRDNLQLNDEYLSKMCQELRTPLTNMKTALSLLNSPNLKAPQRQRYIQMLNNQCDRQNA
jgi:Sensory domain in DIguanylate Cyclases and Two-component system